MRPGRPFGPRTASSRHRRPAHVRGAPRSACRTVTRCHGLVSDGCCGRRSGRGRQLLRRGPLWSRSGRHVSRVSWQARWRDPAGADRKATFPNKYDAERHLVAIESDKIRVSSSIRALDACFSVIGRIVGCRDRCSSSPRRMPATRDYCGFRSFRPGGGFRLPPSRTLPPRMGADTPGVGPGAVHCPAGPPRAVSRPRPRCQRRQTGTQSRGQGSAPTGSSDRTSIPDPG